jgi:hypothetical protein
MDHYDFKNIFAKKLGKTLAFYGHFVKLVPTNSPLKFLNFGTMRPISQGKTEK